jgi:ferredoxin-type protein NapF
MSADSSAPNRLRRSLLQARGSVKVVARPPRALSEALFLQACSRCDDCVRACPERVLVRGDGGFPELRWGGGECTFCAACVDACAPKALDELLGELWPWRATVGQACFGHRGIVCKSCGDVCPTRAIRFATGSHLPSLDTSQCSGCGACVGVCPAAAITMSPRGAAQ